MHNFASWGSSGVIPIKDIKMYNRRGSVELTGRRGTAAVSRPRPLAWHATSEDTVPRPGPQDRGDNWFPFLCPVGRAVAH